ncbi:hypothetical protein IGI04_023517 [Brassica rapa subsp. trilocularis]|uniref:Uncharacterized protein n=1 Tax=Brassica rapa subsp. trilocularis TaxID=1813537 RepID=A0ABQ7M7H8_BRACM|nr:hypothetical protein IGI04_023517 [Brassica rapa subsp. trilocularis]
MLCFIHKGKRKYALRNCLLRAKTSVRILFSCLDSQTRNSSRTMYLFKLRYGYWENDIESIVHMGFGNVQQQ